VEPRRVERRQAAAGAGATDVGCDVELQLLGVMGLLEPLLRRTIREDIEQTRPAALRAALAAPETGEAAAR
jgi:hypothetical protein